MVSSGQRFDKPNEINQMYMHFSSINDYEKSDKINQMCIHFSSIYVSF